MKACPQCNLKYPSDKTVCFVDGAGLVEIQDPRIGTTLGGRYVIEGVLGEGGMATVYRATHRLVDRTCAVKIMSRAFAGNEVIRERFRREAKAAQKLAHPNIIEIFDQGETTDGCLYLVMELLEGQTLADLLDQGAVPPERALPILIQIGRALARAHDLEVIHRDLKPENIFLADDEVLGERAVLLDFGIARSTADPRLTGSGEVFGTPQYMAPERITTIDAGPSADLYAVGVMLYEMMTGQLPFEAPDVATYFVRHLKDPAPSMRVIDPSIPEALDKLALELMAKTPEERPVDAHRVVADLTAVAGALGVRIPDEPQEEIESSRGPAQTLPPVALDRWVRRTGVFEHMLEAAFGGSRPAELVELLEQVKALVRHVTELRSKSMAQQRHLESIESRGRDGRQRFGHAVHALGVDASRHRDEAKSAQARAESIRGDVSGHKQAVLDAHKAVMFWEGRSAFSVPYPQLAAAYRTVADRVDAWLAAHTTVAEAEAEAAKRRAEVDDIEFQIQELRSALSRHEEAIERETTETQQSVSKMGDEADKLETELLELATRFCAPLRKRKELQPMFRELEEDGNQAA
ncbi:MAG TPA: serine/threonine-protein kinase [Polyangiaceae bacterium]|nr:serine/threonine-protein kinase [Polyangiaceae bacterium]